MGEKGRDVTSRAVQKKHQTGMPLRGEGRVLGGVEGGCRKERKKSE